MVDMLSLRDEEESMMPKNCKQYPLEYRRRMVDLVHSPLAEGVGG